MSILEMMQQSTILTILGMAVVFGFLAIMVFCISLLSKLINRTNKKQPVENDKVLPDLVAAISTAVNEYQKPKEY